MKHNIWKWLKCSVSFESVGGLQQRFLNACAENAITVQSIKATPQGFTAQTTAACYLKMHTHARRFRCKLHVTQKTGWRYTFRALKGRWGIPLGIAAFCVILFAFPSLLWSMRFYDFTQGEQAELRRALYAQGIYEGCFITEERLSRAKIAVSAQNEAYAHIALNLYAGRITAEKVDLIKPPQIISKTPSNVVAICDGIVESWDKVNGFVHIKKGQSVAKGQVLISGVGFGLMNIPYYVAAYGDVYATVEQTYKASQPLNVQMLLPCTNVIRSYKINGAGLEINIENEDDFENAKYTQSRYPLEICGFALPFTVTCTEAREYSTQAVSYTYASAHDAALARAYTQLCEDFPGCVVMSKSETAQYTQSGLELSIKYIFRANIAKTVDFNDK